MLARKFNEMMKETNLITQISLLRDKANKFILKELEKNGIKGLVTSHGDILVLLYKKKRVTMKEIALHVNRDKSTVTALVDKLIKYNYIRKDKGRDDSRISYISLTAKGEKLKPVFFSISEALSKKFFNIITGEEVKLFLNVLDKLNSSW